MKSTLKAIVCLLALSLFGTAHADFVVGGGSGLPTGKVDLFPAPNSLNYVSANDWNTGMQALLDLRTKTFNYNIQTITTSQTLTTASSTWNVNATGLTVTLPTGVLGTMYLIKDVTGNANPNCTISPTNGNIDGAGTKSITSAFGWIAVRFNGTNWDVVNQSGSANGLLGVYQAASSTSQNILTLTSALGSVVIRDNATPLGGSGIFALQNSSTTINYLQVGATGINTTGPLAIGNGATPNQWWFFNNSTAGTATVPQAAPDLSLNGRSFSTVDVGVGYDIMALSRTFNTASYTTDLDFTPQRNGTFATNPTMRLTWDGTTHTVSFGGSITGGYGFINTYNGAGSIKLGASANGGTQEFMSIDGPITGFQFVVGGTSRFYMTSTALVAPNNNNLGDNVGDHFTAGYIKTLVEPVAPTTLASAATITPTQRVHFVSGTTQITTIATGSLPAGFNGDIILIPTGAWTTATGGNVANAITATANVPVVAVFDSGSSKWYLHQ